MTAEDLRITPENTPSDWKLVDEIRVLGEDVTPFSSRLSAKVKAVLNQIFETTDGRRVQVNFVECLDDIEAAAAIGTMHQVVGNVNRLLQIDNVVVEIIAPDSALKDAAAEIVRRAQNQA